MNPLADLFDISMKVHAILVAGRGHQLSANYLARHVAEEAGEAVGAHNKYVDGRGTRDRFAHEWAQALINLVMLGACHLTKKQMSRALQDALVDQQRRWS